MRIHILKSRKTHTIAFVLEATSVNSRPVIGGTGYATFSVDVIPLRTICTLYYKKKNNNFYFIQLREENTQGNFFRDFFHTKYYLM